MENMNQEELTFDGLPKTVARILDELLGMKAMLSGLQKGQTQQKAENRHIPLTVKEASEIFRIPVSTLHQKLERGEVPGTKPGKVWILYRDEMEKWIECHRVNPVPLTPEEQNAAILASHRRKPGRFY